MAWRASQFVSFRLTLRLNSASAPFGRIEPSIALIVKRIMGLLGKPDSMDDTEVEQYFLDGKIKVALPRQPM